MQTKSSFRRLFGYLSRYRWPFALGNAAEIIVEAAIELTLAYLIKELTNAAVNLDGRLLLQVAIICTAVTATVVAILPVAIRARRAAAERAGLDLRQSAFEHINALPQAELEKMHSGDLVSRLTNDVTAAKEVFGTVLTQFGVTIFVGLACAVYMVSLSWQLALVAFSFAVLPYCFNRATAGPLKRRSSAVQASLGRLNAQLKDMLTGSQVVRAFRQEERFAREYREQSSYTLQYGLSRVWMQSFVNAGNNMLGGLGMISLLALACYFIMTKQLSPGAAVASVQLMNRIIRPFQVLGELWGQLQHSLAAAERLFGVIDSEPEALAHPRQTDVRRHDTALHISNLTFSYDNQPALQGVEMEASQGQMIALAGPSGSGKSTLFKLLLGLYPIGSGHITVAGQDLCSLDLYQLRQLFAYVPQDSYLFTGTIGENIAHGRPGASREEVVQAAIAANAHDFIVALPQGYDTPVGERGTQLSGGQRQRISIARAILKDAPFLLLDEATSSLDSEAEALVQAALQRLMAGRTTLVIAHRLSTIQNADRIYVLADGQVAESGTHDELLAFNGLYRQLVTRQQQPAA